jgi:hypothetical protein
MEAHVQKCATCVPPRTSCFCCVVLVWGRFAEEINWSDVVSVLAINGTSSHTPAVVVARIRLMHRYTLCLKGTKLQPACKPEST